MVAFALMFATSIGVAQEKVNVSDDNVEVKESVEAANRTNTSIAMIEKVANVNQNVNNKQMTEIRGVLSHTPGTGGAPGKYYLTNAAVTETSGDCAQTSLPCRIELDPDDIQQEGAQFYIEDDADFEVLSTNGPYIE